MEAPEGILNDPCRGFYVFSKMDMIFEDEDEDGRRADFAIGVAQNAILELKILRNSVFSRAEARKCSKKRAIPREGWLKTPPKATICDRGRSKCLPGPRFATGVA